MQPYKWESRSQFVNRVDDLAALERWWANPTRDATALLGRRRVGKSWLFRRLADGKPAVILVADLRLPSTQMSRFAEQLEPLFGVRPEIPDLHALITALYRLGHEQKILAVIDEFPYLVPDGAGRAEALTEVQAAMENEREGSQTKLLLCGSSISQMESLLEEHSPLHGRLRELDLWPMSFAEGKALSEPRDGPQQRITRYAITGGMARYLAELGRGQDLKTLVCDRVLDRRGPLFNDPRVVLERELRSATYFSVMEELADHPAQTDHLTGALGVPSNKLSPYLNTLQRLRLLEASLPVGAPDAARGHKFRISDGFVRFWFRFVFPNHEGLQSGLQPEQLWDAEIEPALSDFVASTFEELCIRYTRTEYGGQAPRVGGWWGPALNKHRRAKTRLSEEVDVVAAKHKNLRIVGECKWTASAMPKAVLDDLRNIKIPAIAQEKRLKVSKEGPQVLLFSRSGFDGQLEAEAAADPRVTLVGLDALVTALDGEGRSTGS